MLSWQIKQKVKKQTKLIRDKKEKNIVIQFCMVFYFIVYLLKQENKQNFTKYYNEKLSNLDISEMQTIIEDSKKKHKPTLLMKIIKYFNLENEKTLFNIFSLYLKSIVLYDSIEEVRFFYDKKYNQESNKCSIKRFGQFLNLKILMNEDIKKIFKYQYGYVIDFVNKSIGIKS